MVIMIEKLTEFEEAHLFFKLNKDCPTCQKIREKLEGYI